MKIIKPGIDKSHEVYTGTCHSCECVFELERREITQLNQTFSQFYADCPHCKHFLVKVYKLPTAHQSPPPIPTNMQPYDPLNYEKSPRMGHI